MAQIVDLCVRDASYIAANMRPADIAEIGCLWERFDPRVLGVCAATHSVPGFAWSIRDNKGQPIAAYGMSYAAPFDPEHWQAWAFGTDRFRRVAPLMTRHLQSIRDVIETNCRRLQVITHVEHDLSHEWLRKLGAKREGLLKAYGRNREDFEIYAWVRQERGADE
ncbi:hypothetical protein [uncultured Roseibium sp.]|uniref:hypothetical protein n=1 Tax=uncultured Roseibium sp. TaxID=1936171 RepID=UPI00259586A0|nr:hypothetical protein [uncultured Roseibium sp.]